MPGKRRPGLWFGIAGGSLVVLVLVAVGLIAVRGGNSKVVPGRAATGSAVAPAHKLTTPAQIADYELRPDGEGLDKQEMADLLGQTQHGRIRNRVIALYYKAGDEFFGEANAEAVLFVGAEVDEFRPAEHIRARNASYQQKGAEITPISNAAGGGQVACMTGKLDVFESVTICYWADNDTFGHISVLKGSDLAGNVPETIKTLNTLRPALEKTA